MTIAELEKWLKTNLEATKLRLKATEELEKLANDAVKAGDQGDLDVARAGLQRPTAVPTQKEVDDNFRKDGQGNPALKKLVEDIRVINKRIDAIRARINTLRIAGAAASGAAGGMTLDDLMKWLKAQLAATKLRLEAMKTLETLAQDAMKAGDAGDLDAAKAGTQRPTQVPTQKEIDGKFARSGQGNAGLKKIVEELRALNKEIDAIKARIQNMKLASAPAIDFKALARALRLDKFPNASAKLEKALKFLGDARRKALEAIQAEFKITFAAREMDSLMKAGVP